jgi:O-antigen ligase
MTPARVGGRTPWAPPTYTAATGRGAGGVLRLGFLCFCFYVFAFYSRILDLGLSGLALLHLPGIALGVGVGMAALSGRIAQGLQSRIGVFLAGLSIWMAITIPGSFWRGGSVKVFTGNWIPTLLLFLVAAAVITTAAQCRRALLVLGLATATGAMTVTLLGADPHGRLRLAGSGYANSNTIAIMLLLGMPMVWLLAAGPQVGKVRKVLVGGVLLLMVAAMLRTGSREGLVGLAALCATAFVRSRALGKVAIAFSVVVLALASVVFLPQSVKARLGTIFGRPPQYVVIDGDQAASDLAVANEAAESSNLRMRVLEDSLKVTASHPFLGVGPGNFAPYCADQVKKTASSRFAAWVGTHNTYTELTSEMGIPALILYLGVLVASMGTLQRIYRRANRIPGKEARDIAYTALALHTSFVAFCIVCFFSHMAYGMAMPLMAAIALALDKTAPDQLRRMEEAARASNAAVASELPRANPSPTRARTRS